MFGEIPIGLQVPVKAELMVKDAPPGIRGDTSRAGMKQITLETGAIVNAPLFIETGETVVINTDTGEYVNRIYIISQPRKG